MKLLSNIIFGCGLWAALSGSSLASVIAYWDFNTAYASADKSPEIAFSTATGSGMLYQQRADTDGNGKGGNAFVDNTLGINAAAGQAMAWDDIAKSTAGNDAEFFVTFSTTSFSNLIVSFDIQGNAAALIPSFDLKYALTSLQDVVNPPGVTGTIKDFSGGISTVIFNNYAVNAGAAFTHVVLNLSGVTDLNNQGVVALRFDDWSNGTGNNAMRIDNVLVAGTAIPEPASSLLGACALLGLLRRRR